MNAMQATKPRKPEKPPAAFVLGGIALLLAVGALGGGAVVLWRAWSQAAPDHSEFWTVGVPGVATGAGTMLLALATVWVSARERRNAAWERAQGAERLHAADEHAALREARKVVSTLSNDGKSDVVSVVNAGRETIVDIYLVSVRTSAQDEEGATCSWSPELRPDESGEVRVPLPEAPFIAPGETLPFAGKVYRHNRAGSVSAADIRDVGLLIREQIQVAWTDASGRHWRRFGMSEPQRTNAPYGPGRDRFRFWNSENSNV